MTSVIVTHEMSFARVIFLDEGHRRGGIACSGLWRAARAEDTAVLGTLQVKSGQRRTERSAIAAIIEELRRVGSVFAFQAEFPE